MPLLLKILLISTIALSAKWQTLSNPLNSKNTIKGLRNSTNISSPKECARPCEKGQEPKICYYEWTIENYSTKTGSCDLCRPTTDTFLTSDCQCIEADGVEVSGIMVANRMYPGPAIQVCLGDLVVVDVKNKASGSGITIHWHGIDQIGTPYADGAPYVTQCPISEGNTFRYQWRAENRGTHFWHAHSGFHKVGGLEGAVVIRGTEEDEPYRSLYDHDVFDNLIFMSNWMHDNFVDHWPGTTVRKITQVPHNVLINGKGQWMNATTGRYTNSPLAIFDVKLSSSYRFRLVNGLTANCPIQLTIEKHNVTLIAADGHDIKPKNVTTITSASGERYDFILNADKEIASYWIQMRAFGGCKGQQQHAILRYNGANLDDVNIPRPPFSPGLSTGIILNKLDELCDDARTDRVCITDLESAELMDPRIALETPDVQLFVPIRFHKYKNEDLFKPNTYNRYYCPNGEFNFGSLLDNISLISPPSPILSQFEDIPANMICNSNHLPKSCTSEIICHCVHVIDVPLNAVVEIVLIDSNDVKTTHPFHLHGYSFHVIGQGSLRKKFNITHPTKPIVMELDKQGYIERQFKNPPVKDTLSSVPSGYTVIRFIASNPGYWLFHCHILNHQLTGMSLILHVGEPQDLPPVPEGFPRCGNFIPKINFPPQFT